MNVPLPKELFVTFFPRKTADKEAIRTALLTEDFPVAEQAQFAGLEALESAVEFGKISIQRFISVIKKLADADRIEKVVVQVGNKTITIEGIPKNQIEAAEKLAVNLLDEIRE